MQKVLILFDRVPPDAAEDEKDVLVQVNAVSLALRACGFEPVDLPVTLDLDRAVAEIKAHKPAFVFNLVESLTGKGRMISILPCLLESLKISFTGCGADAIYLSSQKIISKKILRLAGILTPDWQTPDEVIDSKLKITPPLIVKPAWEHASIGITEQSVFENAVDFITRAEIFKTKEHGPYFVEQYIDGREFNIALLADRNRTEVLPPAEIVFSNYPPDKPRIVDYHAKWSQHTFEYNHTPRNFDFPAADGPLLSRLKETALACWKAFGLNGYARVDMRVDKEERIWVLDINANPCLSPDSGFTASALTAGISYENMIARIVKNRRIPGKAM